MAFSTETTNLIKNTSNDYPPLTQAQENILKHAPCFDIIYNFIFETLEQGITQQTLTYENISQQSNPKYPRIYNHMIKSCFVKKQTFSKIKEQFILRQIELVEELNKSCDRDTYYEETIANIHNAYKKMIDAGYSLDLDKSIECWYTDNETYKLERENKNKKRKAQKASAEAKNNYKEMLKKLFMGLKPQKYCRDDEDNLIKAYREYSEYYNKTHTNKQLPNKIKYTEATLTKYVRQWRKERKETLKQ